MKDSANGKRANLRRQTAHTVLLVGEGDSEVAFLRHLKALYVMRGCGVTVTIKNARGKGAAHVVDVAVRQSRNAAYDVAAVLLDTDTDWNDKTRATARKMKVGVVASKPCLEALLLAAYGQAVVGKSAANLKQAFSVRFGAVAFDPKVYQKYFPRDFMEEARRQLPELDEILRLLVK